MCPRALCGQNDCRFQADHTRGSSRLTLCRAGDRLRSSVPVPVRRGLCCPAHPSVLATRSCRGPAHVWRSVCVCFMLSHCLHSTNTDTSGRLVIPSGLNGREGQNSPDVLFLKPHYQVPGLKLFWKVRHMLSNSLIGCSKSLSPTAPHPGLHPDGERNWQAA